MVYNNSLFVRSILTTIIALIIISPIVFGALSPYSIKIITMEPEIDCLRITRREIINNCQENITLYNQDGTLNKDLLIINKDDWDQNYYSYKRLENETGIDIIGYMYLEQFDEIKDRKYFYYTVCGTRSAYILSNGIDFCDKEALDKKVKETGMMVLEEYSTRFKIGGRDVTIESELRYYDTESGILFGRQISLVILILSIIVEIIIVYTMIKNHLSKEKIPDKIWILFIIALIVIFFSLSYFYMS